MWGVVIWRGGDMKRGPCGDVGSGDVGRGDVKRG